MEKYVYIIVYPESHAYAIGPFLSRDAAKDHFRKFPVAKEEARIVKMVKP